MSDKDKEIAEMREALIFYADIMNWGPHPKFWSLSEHTKGQFPHAVDVDHGRRAKEVLKKYSVRKIKKTT